MIKKIAAITMARNDDFFLNRWISYYGRELGHENLFIILDGLDQKELPGANIEKLEHHDMSRAAGDKHRIKLLSDLAADLFARGYDIVLGCDADEFLAVDPDAHKSLTQYLSDLKINTTVSGLGLDVGQNLNNEKALDKSKPFLAQREYAVLSTRYTKPVVLAKHSALPRWGSGFHSVKNHNFHIDPNLYLFHFGNVDYGMMKNKARGRNKTWRKHIDRQIARTVGIISKKRALKWPYVKIARWMQTWTRPIYAWNKPAQFGLKRIVKIPARFSKSGI